VSRHIPREGLNVKNLGVLRVSAVRFLPGSRAYSTTKLGVNTPKRRATSTPIWRDPWRRNELAELSRKSSLEGLRGEPINLSMVTFRLPWSRPSVRKKLRRLGVSVGRKRGGLVPLHRRRRDFPPELPVRMPLIGPDLTGLIDLTILVI
jgi:hypothetical protein